MIIGGLLKFSLIDYPGKIGAIIFTRGCNFRCPYCHNPQLVLPRRFQLPLENKEILGFLQKRFGLLDGVVITGGEPLLQDGIEDFLRKIVSFGYTIKLDTNGSRPSQLKKLINLNLLDYIAMDIKAPFSAYPKTTHVPVNLELIQQSMEIIRQSNLNYEFRTTLVKNLLSLDEIKSIADLLLPKENYFLQNYIDSNSIASPKEQLLPFSEGDISELVAYFRARNINCQSR